MLQLIITDRVHRKLFKENKRYKLISLRPLRKKEIALAKKRGLQKHFLKLLTAEQSENFFRVFDRFWNEAIAEFTPENPFWRNVVSSKMQEWERSAAFLALTFFTLSHQQHSNSKVIIVICSSIEEEDVWETWGKKNGWKVIHDITYLPRLARRIIQEARNLVRFLYFASACFYKKWYTPICRIGGNNSDSGFLIVSLFYKSAINQGNYQDPFFGHLHRRIIAADKNVWYLASPIGDYRNSARKATKLTEVPLILPLSIISWGRLLKLVVRLYRRRLNINRSVFQVYDFSDLLSWNARRFDFFFNFDAEIFYIAVEELCKIINIEKLILIYEGNVFERACIQAFRKYFDGKVLGYSHAVVFQNNLKIRVTDDEKLQRPEPDVLITSGPETRNLLLEVGNRTPESVIPGCSLRYIPTRGGLPPSNSPSTILVALDGVGSSVSILEWLMQRAHLFKGYEVNLRGHPNVPIEKLLTQCICDKPENFFVSRNSLKEDIESCLCVLYRQTSVGLQALMNGVPVIHLAIDAPLVCDPIRDFTAFKWTIRSSKELSQALQELNDIKLDQKKDAVRLSAAFAERYFTPPDNIKTESFYA